MFSMPIFKQDLKINDKILVILFSVQLVCILLAVGICEMNMVEVSDIFWDTIPIIILPAILEIVLAYQLITKRTEDGTMDFILATANKPEKILTTKALLLLVTDILMILLVAGIGYIAGVYRLAGYWSVKSFLLLNVGAFCLQFFISGFCFFIACRSVNWISYVKYAVFIPLVMYVLYLGYYLVDKLFFLQYLTIFSLFRQYWYATEFFVRYIGMAVYLAGGMVFFYLGKKAFYSRVLNYL